MAISEKYFRGRRSENQLKNRYHSASFRRLLAAGALKICPVDAKAGGDGSDSDEEEELPVHEVNNITAHNNFAERTSDFSHQEDIIIRTVAKRAKGQPPFVAWDDLALSLPGRTPEQIRERWVNHLSGKERPHHASKNEINNAPTLPEDETDGEKTDEGERSSVKKNTWHDRYWGSSITERERNERSYHQPIAHPAGMYPGFPPFYPTANPEMMYQGMMNPQMMPPPSITHGQTHPPNERGSPWIPTHASFQVHPHPSAEDTRMQPRRSIPQGKRQLVKLTLPAPGVKLGILLDDCPIFGLPELKKLAEDSPLCTQIPSSFQTSCVILSLESRAIGYAEPKNARQCIRLIAKSREDYGDQLEVVLLQKNTAEAHANLLEC